MIPQLQKAMTLPKGLTAAILVFLMLAAAITTAAAASGTPQPLSASLPENSPAGASLGTPMETTAPAGTVSYSLSGAGRGTLRHRPRNRGDHAGPGRRQPRLRDQGRLFRDHHGRRQPGRQRGKRRRAGQRLPERQLTQVRRGSERQPDRPRRQRERPILALAALHGRRLGGHPGRNGPGLHPRGRRRGPEAPGRCRL